MTTLAEITQRNHRRAVRFFWGLLIGATLVSLIGAAVHPTRSHPDRCRRSASRCSPRRRARHRPGRPCGGIWQGLLLGGQRGCRHPSRRIWPELPVTA
jgi:hypothetical protein